MILDNYLQAMLLLSAIPCEWDCIASMYCEDMTRSWASFDGVQTAIMAEYEQIACPSQLAHHADKISVVKHKGKSPQFKEQRRHSVPKPSAADKAPSGLSSKKLRRGGKREKAQKAHLIVSSAFIPTSVLNCMQESHHAMTSHIEEVPVELTPAPGFTMVGGPSQAPVISAAPATIANFKPSGIIHSKAVQQPPQSIAESSSKKAPFNMEKERKLLKKAGVRPTVEPLCAMHEVVQQQEKAMDTVLGKHCKFMEFATNSSPVQNTVALLSKLPNAPVEPSLLDTLPVPSFKTIKKYD